MSVRENEEESHNSLTVEHELYEGSTKLWVGKDYTNFIVKDFDHLDQPLKGFKHTLAALILYYPIF